MLIADQSATVAKSCDSKFNHSHSFSERRDRSAQNIIFGHHSATFGHLFSMYIEKQPRSATGKAMAYSIDAHFQDQHRRPLALIPSIILMVNIGRFVRTF
jgi:hypothetical protein